MVQTSFTVNADGSRIDAVLRGPDVAGFRLAAAPHSLRICSHAGAPAEFGLARDARALGVAVRQIALWQHATVRVLQADDAALTDGFHDYEADCGWRWTNGDAAVPEAALAGLAGPMEVVMRLGGATQYIAAADRPPV